MVMPAISLGALQQADVPQMPRSCQRVEQIGKHPAILLNQALVKPPAHKPWRFGHRGVNEMRHWRQRRNGFGTGGAIIEINGKMLKYRAFVHHRQPAGKPCYTPSRQTAKMLDRTGTDNPAGPGDKDMVARQCATSLRQSDGRPR